MGSDRGDYVVGMKRCFPSFMMALLLLPTGWVGCDEAPTASSTSGGTPIDQSGLTEALESCTPGIPCPIVTYAFANCLDLVPVHPDRPLGVFDAQQGGVATWITLVVANAPEEHPFIQLEVFTEDGPLNFKEENGPKTLKVPFLPLDNKGIRYQDQYMVPFDAVCCAEDYEGMEATLRLTITYPDMDSVTGEWPITLGEDPWPLDEDTALSEQCECSAWPSGIPRDTTLCE